MRALITGVTGFTGSHLAEYLIREGHEAIGTVRGRNRQTEFIEDIKHNIALLECDLTDTNSVSQTLDEASPDVIFHLAAQSFVPTSWRAPQETINTNVIGTLNILESIRRSKSNPVIQIAGSSEEYGLVLPEETPIKETNQLRPLSPYAVSKVAQDLLGYQYHKSYGMNVVRTRAFNIVGPRSAGKIVTAAFAKQITEIEKGLKEPVINVGNLDSFRDFTDVRDIVRAYVLAIEKCDYGEAYNICSGKTWKIRDVLDMLISMSTRTIEIREDPVRMRPSDVQILLGDCTKFMNKTGWKPQIPFEQTLQDVMNYWKQKVA
jgi:GDP-4-dehydro-6-deoxy-D-mannose reductase